MFHHPVDENNISDLENHIPRPNSIKGSFKQTKTLKEVKRNFVSNGTFSFSKNNGLHWKTTTPFASYLIFTQDALLKVEDDGRKVPMGNNHVAFKEIANIFQSLFSGEYENLQEYFNIFFIKENKQWVIGLEPNSQMMKDSISRITLKGDYFIKEIFLEEGRGDKTLIKFSNVSKK